jgi:hypothetical protein
MELLILILVAALATGLSSHLFFVSPMMKKLKTTKPGSFAAKNRILVPVVSFIIACITFPVMMLILLSSSASQIFSDTIEASFGQE